jgi:hypothetical protein
LTKSLPRYRFELLKDKIGLPQGRPSWGGMSASNIHSAGLQEYWCCIVRIMCWSSGILMLLGLYSLNLN